MPSNKLPSELWDHILSFCDHPSECALCKVSPRLANVVTERNECALARCRREGSTVATYFFSFDNADFPLYTKLLLAHDPFGCCVTPRASSVRGFDVVMEKDGLQSFTSEKADLAHRGTLEFLLDYDSVGIPRWIIDGLRPMITVSVVLQRADGSTDGPKVSAKIGVCRLDGMSQVGTFKSKENIYMNTLVVDNGYSDSRFEVEFEPSTTLHDHPEFGGSDGIRISLSTRDKVRVSHVHLQFTLPDEMPAEFSDWLTESRQLREFRSLHEARPCIDIGLFGL